MKFHLLCQSELQLSEAWLLKALLPSSLLWLLADLFFSIWASPEAAWMPPRLGSQLPLEWVIQEKVKKKKWSPRQSHKFYVTASQKWHTSFIFYWSHRLTLLCERMLCKGLKIKRPASLEAILAVIGWLLRLWFKILIIYLVVPINHQTVSTL